MVSEISETVFGWSTARGGKRYMLPKSLAASSLSLKLQCPSRGSACSDERIS
jgi:hypothetical protein